LYHVWLCRYAITVVMVVFTVVLPNLVCGNGSLW
jgi:hypothetical protein